jgi:hypothetical protein
LSPGGGQKDQAVKEGIAVNPANAESYLELGEAYFRQENTDTPVFSESRPAKWRVTPFPFYLALHTTSAAGLKRKGIEKAITENPKVSQGEPMYTLSKSAWMKAT